MSDKMITLTPSVFMGGNSHGFNFSAGIVAGLYSDKLSKDIKSGNNFQGIFGLVPWAGPSYDFYDLTDGFENKKLGGVGGVNAFYLPSGMSFGVGWSNGVSVEQNLNRNRLEVGFRSYLNVGLPFFGVGPALAIQNFHDSGKTLFFGIQIHGNIPVYGLEL